ncbi:putative porin [Bacteroides sp. OttesenSCG-928-D19]|nr:putative porin [Bacteroides sp. OttesenSCG-928-D19]
MAQSGKRGITPRLNAAPSNLSDSLLLNPDSSLISTNRTTAYRLTEKLGERYIAPMDTGRLNFANSTMMDGRGLAVSYLGNIGSPAQSRIFSERDHNENDFIYANAYNYYITTPTNALFYDVKDPYTRITYLPHLFGDKTMSEEMLNGVMTTNFGKKINIGTDFDYTYVRGHYASNADKMLYYRFFGSYLSDRYEMHAYFRNHNYLNTENGGITDDRYVTHPDDFTDGKRKVTTKDYPTRFTNTWNRVKGKQFFLTHRYNLGFYREMTIQEKEENEKKKEAKIKRDELLRQEAEMHEHTDEHPNESEQSPGMPNLFSGEPGENPDEEEDIDAIFVPVSSIIHTFEYEGSSRRFVSNSTAIDTCYNDIYTSLDSAKNDFTEAWHVKNTIGLSLREGFQDWAKFGLTAYINFDKRRFTLPTDSGLLTESYDEFSTYLGAELSKQQGRLLTYKARGEFCLVGDDIGEFRVEGDLKTQFRLMGKDASVKASGYIKNMTPAFYTRHHHSRYFWWDQSFKNIQRVYAGGEIDLQQTRTKISAGVESIQNYIFFGNTGMPEQYGSNLQVINARIKQDFRYKAFGWENEVAYQLSSEKNVLPLPQISAYSNIYIDFAYAKVLKIQLGADAHYYTSYYAPYYEPATQQFQNQHEKKIGNYPIINAYANFRLKQARFFISGYNVGSLFITPSKHFSLLHYPVNPMMIKLGISVYFNN